MATATVGPDRLPLHLPAYMLASPLATTSKVTLDSFLHEDHNKVYSFLNQERQDLWTALSFAGDDELLQAALAPSDAPERSESWLSPSSAYMGLRSSGLFSHHLQVLLPRIRTLYANLRPSGTHQLLVSDLLLRNPDERGLREVLVQESESSDSGDELRAGLIAQIYTLIAPSLRRRTAPPLPRATLLMVARALRDQHNHDLLPDLFYQLAHSSNWTPQEIWPMLDISLFLAKNGNAASGLRLLQYPIALGKLPSNALGRSSAKHPEAASLMAQSAVVRTAMAWGMDARAARAADDLIDTMVKSEISPPALDLVYTIVRAAAVSRRDEHIAWAGRTLLRLASEPAFPPIPKPELDIFLSALPTPAALDFYVSLPGHRHAPPDPHHILRLALARPSKPLLRRLVGNLTDSTQGATAAVPGVLRALASARMLDIVKAVYKRWSTSKVLDSHTIVSLVRAFTRGARTSQNTKFARSVLADYLDTNPPKVLGAVTAVHAHALIISGEQAESPYIETLVSTLGRSGACERLQQLALRYPLLSHRLQQAVKGHDLELPASAVALAAACASRRWGVLAAFQRQQILVSDAEKGILDALVLARKRRLPAAVKKFVIAAKEAAGEPILVPAAAALLHRAAEGHWQEGLDVLCATLEHADVAAEGGEAVVEHACVFLSGLRNEGVDLGDHAGRIKELAEKLHPAPKTLLLAFLEGVSGKTP